MVGLSPERQRGDGLGERPRDAKPVVTGTYTATETGLAAGWTQTNTSRVKNATGSSFIHTGTFRGGASDSVVCTFTNTRDTGIGDGDQALGWWRDG